MKYRDFRPRNKEILVSLSFEEINKLYELTGNFEFKIILDTALADQSYLEEKKNERFNKENV